MNSALASRIEKLEEQLKAFSKSSVWVDMNHNRVRVDINHKRGEELTFDNVRECVDWLQLQISQFENITGIALIDDVSELLEGSQRELFDAIYEGAPQKAIVINLSKNSPDVSIVQIALTSWWHNISGNATNSPWGQEVQSRIDALIQAWDNTAATLS